MIRTLKTSIAFHEGIREQLRSALSATAPSDVLLDLDAARQESNCTGALCSNSFRRKIVIDEVTEQERLVDPIHASEGGKFKRGHCPLPPWAFQSRRYVMAVDAAPLGAKQWLYYAYGEKLPWDDLVKMIEVAFGQFLFSHKSKMQPETLKLVKAMTLLAAQCVRHEVNTGKPLKTQAEVRRLSGLKESNWERHWSPRWKLLRQIFFNLDILGLDFVAHKTRSKPHKKQQVA